MEPFHLDASLNSPINNKDREKVVIRNSLNEMYSVSQVGYGEEVIGFWVDVLIRAIDHKLDAVERLHFGVSEDAVLLLVN